MQINLCQIYTNKTLTVFDITTHNGDTSIHDSYYSGKGNLGQHSNYLGPNITFSPLWSHWNTWHLFLSQWFLWNNYWFELLSRQKHTNRTTANPYRRTIRVHGAISRVDSVEWLDSILPARRKSALHVMSHVTIVRLAGSVHACAADFGDSADSDFLLEQTETHTTTISHNEYSSFLSIDLRSLSERKRHVPRCDILLVNSPSEEWPLILC